MLLLFIVPLLLLTACQAAGRNSQTFYLDSHHCKSPLLRASEAVREREQEQAFNGAVVYSHAGAPQVLSLLRSNFSAYAYAAQTDERGLQQDFERFAAKQRQQAAQLLYPHNLDCELTLRAARSHKIMFYFDFLDIDDALPNGNCNDALYVFAHPNIYAPALEQAGGNSGLCGSTVLRRVFTTTATYLTLNFRTNDRMPNGLGFRIVVTAFTEVDEKGECATTSETFRCARGNGCISSELQCDGVDNCGDGSDEEHCSESRNKGPENQNQSTSEDSSLLARLMQLGVSASLVIAVGSILTLVLLVGSLVCFCTRKRPQQAKWSAAISSVESGKLAGSRGSLRNVTNVSLAAPLAYLGESSASASASVAKAPQSLASSSSPSVARTAPAASSSGVIGVMTPMTPMMTPMTPAFQNRSMNLNVAAPSYSASQYSQYRAQSSRKRNHGLPTPSSGYHGYHGNQLSNSYYGHVASTPSSSRTSRACSGVSRSSMSTASFGPQVHVNVISNSAYQVPNVYQGVLGLGFGQVVQSMVTGRCTTSDTDATSSTFSRYLGKFETSYSSTEDDEAETRAELLAAVKPQLARNFRSDHL